MAGEERTAATPLIGELLRNTRQFSFFQIVRLLESHESGCVPVGHDGPGEHEAIRFRPDAGLGFPSADAQSIERIGRDDGGPSKYRLTVNFLGLYGSVSPLPVFYTEDIIAGNEQESNRRDFFDLFHHRYISFLYRTWEKYRYYLRYRPGAEDRFSRWMCGLIGVAEPPGAGRPPVERPERVLSSIGLLLMHSRSAATLEKLISHYFDGLPLRIEQFVARQVVIEPAQRARLGTTNCTLGRDCTIGERVPDLSGKFRIRIGPLDFPTFRKFLPDGEGYGLLAELQPFLLKDQLEYDVELGLFGAQVPPLELAADGPCRLGWSSWLGHHPGRDSAVVLAGRSAGHPGGGAGRFFGATPGAQVV
ncbi:MAG: type VI secretion system baseplate subunit TssG [Kiloniellaceae bacterium]